MLKIFLNGSSETLQALTFIFTVWQAMMINRYSRDNHLPCRFQTKRKHLYYNFKYRWHCWSFQTSCFFWKGRLVQNCSKSGFLRSLLHGEDGDEGCVIVYRKTHQNRSTTTSWLAPIRDIEKFILLDFILLPGAFPLKGRVFFECGVYRKQLEILGQTGWHKLEKIESNVCFSKFESFNFGIRWKICLSYKKGNIRRYNLNIFSKIAILSDLIKKYLF